MNKNKHEDAEPEDQPITGWLHSARDGDNKALGQLFDAVYPVLYRMAAAKPAVNHDALLSPTAVVNELYLKIAGSAVLESKDRQHFYVTCSRAMRFIIADFARAAQSLKRGGDVEHCAFTTALASHPDRAQELLDIHSALSDLDQIDPLQRELVELKFFGGLTHAEIGRLHGRSERTIKRDWVKARAFLVARASIQAPD